MRLKIFFGEPLKKGDVRKNKAGDIYIEKNNKHFRIDYNKTGFDNNGNIDKPHYHLLKKTKSGKLKDITKPHRRYFKE